MEALRVAPGWTFLDLAGTLLAHACDGNLLLRLPAGWSPVAAEPDRAVLRSGELVLTATHAALHGSRTEVSRHLERLVRTVFAGEPERRLPDTGNLCFRGRAAGSSEALRWVIWTAEGDEDARRLATMELIGPQVGSWAGSGTEPGTRAGDGAAHRWVVLVHADEAGTTCLHAHLSAAGAREGGPAVTSTVERLDRELSHARLLPRPDPGATGGGRAPDEADPFAPLKTITAFDSIRLRVPAIWPCAWDGKAKMWCCCEDIADPVADTGTLWIDVNVLGLGDGVRSGSDQGSGALETMAQTICAQKSRAGDAAPELRDTRRGKAVCYSRAFERNHARFREHRWHCLSLVAGKLVVTHYSLVLTGETADRPAWRRLVDTMDREIRAADFGPDGDRVEPEGFRS